MEARPVGAGIIIVLMAGAWLRWGITPALAAFRAGMEAERINAGAKAEGRGQCLSPEGTRPVGGGS